MTEEDNQIKFKAPSLPQQPMQAPSAGQAQQAPGSVPSAAIGSTAEGVNMAIQPSAPAQATATAGKYDNNFAASLNLPPKVLQTKFFVAIVLGALLMGSFLGCAMAPSSSKPVQQNSGFQRIIVGNPSPFVNRAPLCGRTDVNNACVLYIMNPKPYERWGRDFFEDAANMVRVQPYLVQINNVEYQNRPIPPGFIAEIYIPSRR